MRVRVQKSTAQDTRLGQKLLPPTCMPQCMNVSLFINLYYFFQKVYKKCGFFSQQKSVASIKGLGTHFNIKNKWKLQLGRRSSVVAAHIVTVLPVKEAIDLNCINPAKLKRREYPSKICELYSRKKMLYPISD